MSNNDDFDSDDFDLDGFDDDFGDLENKQGTLGDLWKNNPFVKIGVIVVGILLLVGAFAVFSGEEEVAGEFSRVGSGTDVTETPGSAEVSETYRQAIEEGNTNRLEDALRDNSSVIPMPVEAPKGVMPLEVEQVEQEDPLERWRRLQEEKVKRAVNNAPKITPQDNTQIPAEEDNRGPAIQALSEAIAQQMENVLERQRISGAQTKPIAQIAYLEDLQEKEQERLEEARARALENQRDSDLNQTGNRAILLPAGTIEYAQMLTEANTDVPGTILAELVTGPFKGARLIGSFEESYDYLTLNFSTMVLDGVDYGANAVALDPQTTLPGVATDIDRRYFKRVVLPVAAEFITGFADAIANSGTTTVTISGDSVTETTANSRESDQEIALGVATAGAELSSIVDEIRDNNPPLIRVRAGTPLGILFVDAVNDDQNNDIVGPYRVLDELEFNADGENNN